jgi:hypothetical protein
MRMQRPYYEFNAEDRKVYMAWAAKNPGSLSVLILFGTVLIAVHATTGQFETAQHVIRGFLQAL